MSKIKAIYKTAKFAYYGVPLLWQIKMGRLYALRDSPDWLVTDLAHSGGAVKQGSLYAELTRQAKEEFMTRMQRLVGANISEDARESLDRLRDNVMAD